MKGGIMKRGIMMAEGTVRRESRDKSTAARLQAFLRGQEARWTGNECD